MTFAGATTFFELVEIAINQLHPRYQRQLPAGKNSTKRGQNHFQKRNVLLEWKTFQLSLDEDLQDVKIFKEII